MLWKQTHGLHLSPDPLNGGSLVADSSSDGGIGDDTPDYVEPDSKSTVEAAGVFDDPETPSFTVKPPKVTQPSNAKTSSLPSAKTEPVEPEPEEPETNPEPAPEPVKPEAGKLPAKRDYTQFPEELVQELKKLPNREFKVVAEKIMPKLAEATAKVKELEAEQTKLKELVAGKRLPDNWYEHPEAYQLSEDYQTMEKQFSAVASESGFYRQQLLKIERGEQFQVISGYDPRGKPIYSQAYEATPENKLAIMDTLQQLEQAKVGITQKAEQIKQGFTQTYQTAGANYIKQADLQFGGLLPELQPKQPEIDLFMKDLPGVFKNHPLGKVAAKMFGVIINQGKMLNQLKSGQVKTAQAANDAKKAGPKPTTAGKKAPATQSDEIDFDSLKAAFRGED